MSHLRPSLLKPADGHRLNALYHRCVTLRRCGVSVIKADQLAALERVVDLLLVDERRAQMITAARDLPKNFGRLPPAPKVDP